jgi:hypothetical protein
MLAEVHASVLESCLRKTFLVKVVTTSPKKYTKNLFQFTLVAQGIGSSSPFEKIFGPLDSLKHTQQPRDLSTFYSYSPPLSFQGEHSCKSGVTKRYSLNQSVTQLRTRI